MKLKILFAVYWLAWFGMATFAVANQWEGSIGKHAADPVNIFMHVINFGAVIGFFFICLFKIFSVIKRVNQPTLGNLVFWLCSFALSLLANNWLGDEPIHSYGEAYYYYYPHGTEGQAIVFLWVLVCLCWKGFIKWGSK